MMMKSDRERQIEEFKERLAHLEETYDVSIFAKGGSYGGAKMIIKDNKTDEEYDRG